jgi:peptidoglycan/LPS O-acetylase OafA/YrhL
MLNNLTGIRGLASLWVLLYHYQDYILGLLPETKRIGFILSTGYFGVDLFFCLSGFILGHVYYKQFSKGFSINWMQTYKRYLIKRFARIYPVYLFTTLLATLSYLLAFLSGYNFRNESLSSFSVTVFVVNLAGIQLWIGMPSINGPAWSVSAEIIVYLIYPFFVILVHAKLSKFKNASIFLLLTTFILYQTSIRMNLSFDSRIFQVILEFTMGLLAYNILQGALFLEKIIITLRFFVSLLIFASLLVIRDETYLKSIIPLLLLFLIGLNFFHNVPNKGLSRLLWIKLGLWSYSLYLTHRLLQFAMSYYELPILNANLSMRLIQLLILLLLPVLIAATCTKLIEIPSRDALLRFMKRKSI